MWWESCVSGISCVRWSWRKNNVFLEITIELAWKLNCSNKFFRFFCCFWFCCTAIKKGWISSSEETYGTVLQINTTSASSSFENIRRKYQKYHGKKHDILFWAVCHLWCGFLDLCTPFWNWKQLFIPKLYWLNFMVNPEEMLG